MKKIKKPFRNQVALSPREVLSPLDKRDFLIEVPAVSEKEIKMKDNWDYGMPYLDQKSTDYCTAFALFRCFAQHLSGKKREEFLEVFDSNTAFSLALYQISYVNKNFFKKLLRREIWLWKGRNMRAALWNMNHGVSLSNGARMKIKSYYKCIPKTPLDLCKYLAHHGSLFCGLLLRGSSKTWFSSTGRYTGIGKVSGGHAIDLTGYDLKRKVFYFDNSWGLKWGKKGRGEIPFSKFNDIREIWLIEGPEFKASKSYIP